MGAVRMKFSLYRNIRAYGELCKPRVVALMLLTAVVGMLLAPASNSLALVRALIWGTLGVGLMSAAAAAINHVVDAKIDRVMFRTQRRPLPSGDIQSWQAACFAGVIGTVGMSILCLWVNPITAILTLICLVGYAVVYTRYLKRATSQNIVIGGLAGAAPPLLGWTAVTGTIDAYPLLLVLIIFVWTPPHFWALAIARREEYAKARIPMLPVTHGVPYTQRMIVFYAWLLFGVGFLPFAVGMSGWIYLLGIIILGGIFLQRAYQLLYRSSTASAMKLFYYSIQYLFGVFIVLLLDHFVQIY